MVDTKTQSRLQAKQSIQQKPQVMANVSQKVQPKAQSKPQPQPQINGQQDKKIDLKINGKKLGLVLFEVAKQEDSVFSEQQKLPVRMSFMGVFISLSSATLVNMAYLITKPDIKYKKWFLIGGLGSLAASLFLGTYGMYHMCDLYAKIPEEQWQRIKADKDKYDALSFSQKKNFLANKIEDEGKKTLANIVEQQKQRRKQKVEIAK